MELDIVKSQKDPEVIASIVHLMDVEVLEDGKTVGKLPEQMAIFERDLFDRTSEVLLSYGGVLNREAGGFLFPSSVNIEEIVDTLLNTEPNFAEYTQEPEKLEKVQGGDQNLDQMIRSQSRTEK